MSVHSPETAEFESSVNLQAFLLLVLAMALGLLTAVLFLPAWMPNLAFSLSGEAPRAYWYLSRATAFISLSLLWFSMALGIGLSNKMARSWPGAPAAFAVHEYTSLLGLAFALFHALVLLGDHYIQFTLAQILMPFATLGYRPLWVGIGQTGFYAWIIVAFSFYVRQGIGQKTWRLIHYLSFAMYLAGLLHGLFSGTDTSADWARWYYWISGGSLLFLFMTRLVGAVIDRLFPASKRQHINAPVKPIRTSG
jgi:predicted ferric reductase